MRIILPMLFCIFLFGCGQNNAVEKDSYEKVAFAEQISDDFKFEVTVNPSNYEEGESIHLEAQLTYIGDQPSMSISHASSPFYFPMTELMRNYQIDYAMDSQLIYTELTKDVPYTYTYRASGGYSEEDEEAYKKFMQAVMSQALPNGQYVVNGYAKFTDETGKSHQLNGQVYFEVK